MKYFCALLLIATLAAALPKKPNRSTDEFINEINSKQSTWTAGRYFENEDLFKTLASGVKKLLPTKDIPGVIRNSHALTANIPESFDAREAWPECADIIGLIRDQSRCGSCWAFAAAESMSDRICIHSNATRKILVSSQDITTCSNGGGCDGGWPYFAWSSWTDGYVSGGLYKHPEQGCKSYFLPSCDDHPHKCRDYVDTPDCVEACDDSSLEYSKQKTYGSSKIYSFDVEQQIQQEIMRNGPVETDFTVYEDFVNYKSGIYQYVSGEALGGHAVKILGWGVENGVKYWLIANSWNESWGEKGYFRIVRGVDEAGIEDDVVASLPDFSRF